MSLEDLGFSILCKAEAPAPDSSGAVSGAASYWWKALLPFLALGGMVITTQAIESEADDDAIESALYHYHRGETAEALAALYKRFGAVIGRVSGRLTDTVAERDDVVQTAFVPGEAADKVLAKIAAGEIEKKNFKTYVFRELQNIKRKELKETREVRSYRVGNEDFSDEELEAYFTGKEDAPRELSKLIVRPTPIKKNGVEYVPVVTYDAEKVRVEYKDAAGNPLVVTGRDGSQREYLSEVSRPKRKVLVPKTVGIPTTDIEGESVARSAKDEGAVLEVAIEDRRALDTLEAQVTSDELSDLLERAGILPDVLEYINASRQRDEDLREKARYISVGTGDLATIRFEAVKEIQTRAGGPEKMTRGEAEEAFDKQIKRALSLARQVSDVPGGLTRKHLDDVKQYLSMRDRLERDAAREAEKEQLALKREFPDPYGAELYRGRAEELGRGYVERVENMQLFTQWALGKEEYDRLAAVERAAEREALTRSKLLATAPAARDALARAKELEPQALKLEEYATVAKVGNPSRAQRLHGQANAIMDEVRALRARAETLRVEQIEASKRAEVEAVSHRLKASEYMSMALTEGYRKGALQATRAEAVAERERATEDLSAQQYNAVALKTLKEPRQEFEIVAPSLTAAEEQKMRTVRKAAEDRMMRGMQAKQISESILPLTADITSRKAKLRDLEDRLDVATSLKRGETMNFGEMGDLARRDAITLIRAEREDIKRALDEEEGLLLGFHARIKKLVDESKEIRDSIPKDYWDEYVRRAKRLEESVAEDRAHREAGISAVDFRKLTPEEREKFRIPDPETYVKHFKKIGDKE